MDGDSLEAKREREKAANPKLPIDRHFDCIKRCGNRSGGMAGGDCQTQCERLPRAGKSD